MLGGICCWCHQLMFLWRAASNKVSINIQFKSGSLHSCLFCVATTRVHPLSWVFVCFNAWTSHNSVLTSQIPVKMVGCKNWKWVKIARNSGFLEARFKEMRGSSRFLHSTQLYVCLCVYHLNRWHFDCKHLVAPPQMNHQSPSVDVFCAVKDLHW